MYRLRQLNAMKVCHETMAALPMLLLLSGCVVRTSAQPSPQEHQLRKAAEVLFRVLEDNALLPVELYEAQSAAAKTVEAPQCKELISAGIDMKIARSGQETTESLRLLSTARLVISTARLAKSRSEAGADSALASAIEDAAVAVIKAQILRNHNASQDLPRAFAMYEIEDTLCLTAERLSARNKIETIENNYLIQMLGSDLPRVRSLLARVKIEELVDSQRAIDSKTSQAKQELPRAPEAVRHLSEISKSVNRAALLASQKALDAAIKKVAQGR